MTQAAAKRRLVVDACVMLKWQLNDEEHVANAIALRDDFLIADEVELSAPSLLVYELTNGINTAARDARLSEEIAAEALDNLLAAEITLYSPDPPRILALARGFRVSAYDASYLALGERLGAQLWTADRPLYNAVAKELSWVRWIADYPASPA